MFDVEQKLEQGPGGERGVQRNHAVDEARLVENADGLGLDQAGESDDLDARLRAQRFDGGEQRSLAIAEVRAQPDVDTCDVRMRHDASVSLPSGISAPPPAHRARRGALRR